MLKKHQDLINSGDYLKDRKHPSDPTRTLLDDLEKSFEKYETARVKRGLGDTIDLSEITILRQRLAEEYKIGEKDWFQLVKRGKFKFDEGEEEEEGAGGSDELKSAKFEQAYDEQNDQQKRRTGGKFDKGKREKKVQEPISASSDDEEHIDT